MILALKLELLYSSRIRTGDVVEHFCPNIESTKRRYLVLDVYDTDTCSVRFLGRVSLAGEFFPVKEIDQHCYHTEDIKLFKKITT